MPSLPAVESTPDTRLALADLASKPLDWNAEAWLGFSTWMADLAKSGLLGLGTFHIKAEGLILALPISSGFGKANIMYEKALKSCSVMSVNNVHY